MGISGDFNMEVMGAFSTYLGKVARTFDKKNKHLSLEAATGYFSSIKSAALDKFRSQQDQLSFLESSAWRKMWQSISTMVIERYSQLCKHPYFLI